MLILLLLVGGAPAPAALTDPGPARDAALAAPKEDGLRAAETLVLVGDGQAALNVLRAAPGDPEDPRRLNQIAGALEVLGDARALRDVAGRLAAHPGWSGRAARVRAAAAAVERRRWLERAGLGMFAVAVALLGIGGARALISVRLSSVVVGALAFGGAYGIADVMPRVAPLVGLMGAGFAVLAHAAAATVDRTRPDARGRLIAAAVMLLGALGLIFALGARLSAGDVWALVAAR